MANVKKVTKKTTKKNDKSEKSKKKDVNKTGNFVTIKLPYYVDTDEEAQFIWKCRKQFTSTCNFTYNRNRDNFLENGKVHNRHDIRELQKTMNNVELMDSHMANSAVFFMSRYPIDKDVKIVFGGKYYMKQRNKGKLTKEQWQELRLKPLYSMGEADKQANRKFRIQDTDLILFQITRKHHINLHIMKQPKRRQTLLQKLMLLQNDEKIPITYSLDESFIYMTFDLNLVERLTATPAIKGRVMGIDLNPNYIGYVIADMDDEGKVVKYIDQGFYSLKDINDKANALNSKNLPSSSPERKHINNKRRFECFEISKSLALKAKHYQCGVFAIEDLDMRSKDKGKGRNYNRLTNNQWFRGPFVSNLFKRLKLFKINIREVNPAYSSIEGNLGYKDTGFPDMVLAAIEIARRGILYKRYYVDESIPIKHNIIYNDDKRVFDVALASLEECGCEVAGLKSWKDIFAYLKTRDVRYRVHIDEVEKQKKRSSIRFSMKSKHSDVKVVTYV